MRKLSPIFVLAVCIGFALLSVQTSFSGGGMDLDGYCKSHGYTGVRLNGNTVNDWACIDSSGNSHGMDLYDVCRAQYGGGTPIYSNFNDPNSWICQDDKSQESQSQPSQPQPQPGPAPAVISQPQTASSSELGQNCYLRSDNTTVACDAAWVCDFENGCSGATSGDPYCGVFELPQGAAARIVAVWFAGRYNVVLYGDNAADGYYPDSRAGFEFQAVCVHGIEYAVGTGRHIPAHWHLIYTK